MAETLAPSSDEFVVRTTATMDKALARARELGAVEHVAAAEPVHVLRIEGSAGAKATWQKAVRQLGEETSLLPVLNDRDGAPHYPTGEVTVRFEAAPTATDLERLCAEQKLRLVRRNEYAAQQVVCAPVAPASEYLPELVARLAKLPGVRSAWANTLSRYRRGEKEKGS